MMLRARSLVRSTIGRKNIGLGVLFIAGLMILGFVLVYLRDYAPGKEQ